MVGIRDDDRTGAASISGVDERPLVPRLLHDALDGRGFGADNGDEPVGTDHVSKADVDELHFWFLL